MPQNDFLAFGTGAGANVVTQANYANDPVTAAGFSSGIAPSAKFNKIWRQSSFVTAALAQLMCDQLGIDILDDGNSAEFEANLRAALVGLAPRQTAPMGGENFWVNGQAGSDANDGTTPSTAWKTLQHAADWVVQHVDANLQVVTINIVPSPIAYAGFKIDEHVQGVSNPSNLNFQGSVSNPASVIIQAGTTTGACVEAQNNVQMLIQGVRFTNPTGDAIWANNYARVRYGFCDFGPVSGAHIHSIFHAHCAMVGNCTISGGAGSHILLRGDSTFYTTGPLVYTLTGTPHWTNQFIGAGGNSYATFNDPESPVAANGNLTFTGPATGRRGWTHDGAVIHPNVSAAVLANYFPGDAPVLVDSGTFGVYNTYQS
jgi:hypothetical protein